MKILFSNLGYARGIDGSLWQHISRIGRHFYCSAPPQQRVISQLKDIINLEEPDLCCFVEIDKGAFHSSYYNQMNALRDERYRHSDIGNKYGPTLLSRLPLHTSKCNGFLARTDFKFEKLYFKAGRKRLMYRISLPENIALYFAHFSLSGETRQEQFQELKAHMMKDGRPSIVLADFNIFGGFSEVADLLAATDMKLLNREGEFTHRFHKTERVLDLALASNSLSDRIAFKIIPQPYSDHAALLIDWKVA